MSNTILRATLMTLFCFVLSGCAIGIKSTSLKVVPAQPEETQLLTSVGFVLHDAININRDSKFIESERKSWIDALSSFTGRENIFTMSGGKPISIINSSPGSAKTRPDAPPGLTNQENVFTMPDSNPTSMINSFPEFAKTHPIVHVYVKSAPEEKGLSAQDVFYVTPAIVSFLTFEIFPAYLHMPYTASFTLSMPEEKQVSPAHWDYSYDRQEYYWLPLLPVSDLEYSIGGEIAFDTRWKTEEKRRLVLMFLKDAKPLLQEH